MTLTTQYEFTLPRGYVDRDGGVHRTGLMRLATARDELEPLRDPTVIGPDDPRLTVLILARVVDRLGDLPMVTPHEIEGLFAADLAFLQDFYGVINFGNQQEYEALLAAQAESAPLIGVPSRNGRPTNGFGGSGRGSVGGGSGGGGGVVGGGDVDSGGSADAGSSGQPADTLASRQMPRARVEEIPRVPV